MCTKICNVCNIEKDINDFNKYYKDKEIRRGICKYCLGYKNIKKKNDEERLERKKEVRLKYREKELKQKKEYYQKYKNDPIFMLKKRFRQRIYHYIKGNNKSKKTAEVLGCTYEEFKIHIESQFKNGMCWERLNEIHIDHITPISFATTVEEVYKLNHYTNLQPLWAKDNLTKYNKTV